MSKIKVLKDNTHENKKKARQRAKFKIPDDNEIMKDRATLITSQTVEIVKDGQNMSQIRHMLDISESIINFRLKQLGLNEKWELTDKPNIQETFEGAPKPEAILKAELNMDVYNYKQEILAFEKLKDKFLKQHEFKKKEVEQIMTGNFDWTKWTKEYTELKLDETKKSLEESKKEVNPITN